MKVVRFTETVVKKFQTIILFVDFAPLSPTEIIDTYRPTFADKSDLYNQKTFQSICKWWLVFTNTHKNPPAIYMYISSY